ncbi:hypothetical protein EC957_000161 [Mortierella hygrophila]|uniref:Uncharacterized protein n=1 Tax=Mortierella hygrophila TaxID=979708 RepID=A0A9P6K7E2_9FUNG|nr:hypothetical protein EC957_000161 [Mortierella hygrophila]
MAITSIQRRARLDVDCGYGELQAQLAFLQVSILPQPKQIDMWPTGFYGEAFVNIFLSMIQEPYYVTEKLKDDLFDNLHPTSTRGFYLRYRVNKVVERAMTNHLAPPPPDVVLPISLLQGDHDSCTIVAILNFLVNQPNPETLARRLREIVQATLPYTVDARECAMRDNEVYSLHCLVSASATTAEKKSFKVKVPISKSVSDAEQCGLYKLLNDIDNEYIEPGAAFYVGGFHEHRAFNESSGVGEATGPHVDWA